ncbi:glycosyltransferase family 4 protein [Methylomonas sp. AM2-LC]|uniref:glycosyltransferase family 4 protein n=1 Tax=Methylomonas sp. AM2-LC TaxID=3153301 RepID=UPI003263EA0A
MTDIIIATIMRPTGETGVQTHCNSLMNYLSQHHISHRLITPFSYYNWLVYPIFALRKILHVFSGTLSVWWYRHWHAYFLQLALQQQLQSGIDCVIYAQCPVSAAAALKARITSQQRVIMVTHFNISQADEWVGKGIICKNSTLYCNIQKFEAHILPQLDGLVFVSEFMQKELYQRIPDITQVEAIIVPNFLSDPGAPEITHPLTDLICIGSLETRKNQKYLLEIIAALHAQNSDLSVTIVGDGPDRALLEETATRLHINHLVKFSGFISNAAELINSHKACIHVATIENLPITLIEALGRGRPIFATPVGGVMEILGDGSVGIALPLNDAQSAARLVSEAMQNAAWMTKAASAARQRFLNQYASSVSAKRLTQFLLQTSEC